MLAGPRRRLSACCSGLWLSWAGPAGAGRGQAEGPRPRAALRAPPRSAPDPMAGGPYMINDCLQGSISNGPDAPKAGDVERRWVYSYYP